jgi:uncharacterized membrane-anchored protein
MKPGRYLLFASLAVALVQIGILYSMIHGRASILRNGTEVVLQVRPVDPRDLLRGDYVVLAYNVSTVDASLVAEPWPQDEAYVERPIFVRLAPGPDGIWQPVAARFDEPPASDPADGQVDLAGTAFVPARDAPTPPAEGADAEAAPPPAPPPVAVTYGIERFYVPEGAGRPIEQELRSDAFTMRVAVAADGRAQIKSFHQGDVMLFEEPLY